MWWQCASCLCLSILIYWKISYITHFCWLNSSFYRYLWKHSSTVSFMNCYYTYITTVHWNLWSKPGDKVVHIMIIMTATLNVQSLILKTNLQLIQLTWIYSQNVLRPFSLHLRCELWLLQDWIICNWHLQCKL